MKIIVKKRNWIRLISLIIVTIIGSVLLIKYSIIDLEKDTLKSENFQYNAISMSATIGGFLFTGISILISVIDKDRIKRLWENHYLDNLYRAAFVGMISNVITIVIAIFLICSNKFCKIRNNIISVEITTLIVGLVFFAWCIKQLIFLLPRINDKNKKG